MAYFMLKRLKKILIEFISTLLFSIPTGLCFYLLFCVIGLFCYQVLNWHILSCDKAFYISFFFGCPVGSVLGIYWSRWRLLKQSTTGSFAILTSFAFSCFLVNFMHPHLDQFVNIGANFKAALMILLITVLSVVDYHIGDLLNSMFFCKK